VVLYSSSTAVVSGPPSPASYTRRTCVDPIATSVLLQDLSLTTVYPVLLRPRRHPLHGSPSGWVGTGRHWRWHVWPRATARRSNYRNAAAAQIWLLDSHLSSNLLHLGDGHVGRASLGSQTSPRFPARPRLWDSAGRRTGVVVVHPNAWGSRSWRVAHCRRSGHGCPRRYGLLETCRALVRWLSLLQRLQVNLDPWLQGPSLDWLHWRARHPAVPFRAVGFFFISHELLHKKKKT
jgi:hypothetical protein